MHHPLRYSRSGFTLIEMLAVITIMIILAGMVIGGLSFVREREAKEKTKVQVELLVNALEAYKLDYGSYPATENSAKGEDNSKILFQALYWDSDNDGETAPIGDEDGDADQTIYLPDLNPATTKHGWTTGTPSLKTRITDPWGNEYRYRSAKNAQGTTNSSTINPDFDLWSTGKDGKTNPAEPTDKVNLDDIKNF